MSPGAILSGAVSTHSENYCILQLVEAIHTPHFKHNHNVRISFAESADRSVAAIEPLTGSENYATWNRLMTSYLKARQVWHVVSGELQRPDCQFKCAKPITADIVPLINEHLVGTPRQKAI